MKKTKQYLALGAVAALVLTTASAGPNPFRNERSTKDGYSTWDSDLISVERVPQTGRGVYVALMIWLTVLAMSTLAVLVKIYLQDSGRRAADAEDQRHASEQSNRENQDAILRLMNELGDLADGIRGLAAAVRGLAERPR